MCAVWNGDDEVFGDLMRQTSAQMTSYRRWVATPTDYTDLQQELWMALWQALQNHPPHTLITLCQKGGR